MSATKSANNALVLVLLVASGVSISEAVGVCGNHVTNGDRYKLVFFCSYILGCPYIRG